MPAGTIALTNNSATVTGTGTSFTTELKVNDFVVSTVGGVAYTLGVKSIESNTSLTLMENYTGPSASGQSWTPVPYGTMAAITAQLAAQVTYAVRGFNLDKVNWQQIFTGSGTVTVTLPDGTSWQGPSWGYMATQFDGKANTSDVLTKADNLNSLTDKATARTNLGFVDDALPLTMGGTGSKSASDARESLGLGTAATRNTGNSGASIPLLNVANTWGATQTFGAPIVFNGEGTLMIGGGATENASGSNYWSKQYFGMKLSANHASPLLYAYMFEDTGVRSGVNIEVRYGSGLRNDYKLLDSGTALAVNWSSTSEGELKGNIKPVENALAATLSMRGVTWDWNKMGLPGLRGVGVIAQEAEAWCPEAIEYTGPAQRLDGSKVDNARSLNTGALAAAYHTEAIRVLFDMIKSLSDGDTAAVKSAISEIESLIKPFYKDGDPQAFTPPDPVDRGIK